MDQEIELYLEDLNVRLLTPFPRIAVIIVNSLTYKHSIEQRCT